MRRLFGRYSFFVVSAPMPRRLSSPAMQIASAGATVRQSTVLATVLPLRLTPDRRALLPIGRAGGDRRAMRPLAPARGRL